MSDSLVQQIRDAIAERRGLAEDAVDPLADEWFEADGLCDRGMTRPDAAFIEAHSPAAVLALCTMADRVVQRWEIWNMPETEGPNKGRLRMDDWARAERFVLMQTLEDLAVMFGVSPTSKTDQRTEQ